ncbi:MAG TPA: trypsin-like peptidase domain-containing protein [Frankiaceae bacterium]|jgi:putative serine protease PepD|nr:trypsin-like peptidase domain-containing protein [Frankiaceae bacterium]
MTEQDPWLQPPPVEDGAWRSTEQLWSPYSGTPRRGLGRLGTVVAVALGALLVGGLGGAGGAALVMRSEERSGRDPSYTVATGVTTPRDTTPGTVAAIARDVVPAVVSIRVANGAGSGVIIGRDGYIVTNHHVVADADEIDVTLADGTTAEATLVGSDDDTDLAVVKIKVTNLPVARLGRSNDLQVGDPVVVIGSPLGLAGSVTAGIISALHRSLDIPNEDGSTLLVDAIQTDAAINPGNSGGALVDRAGRVIGISSAIASLGNVLGGGGGSISIGFAIPVDEARAVAEQIIRTGRATHPYLGVSGNDLTPQTAKRFGIGVQQGALVMEVVEGGPAYVAGLKARDVVVRLGSHKVASMGDLIAAIRAHRVGETVEVAYVRDGRESTVRVTLGQKPD